MDKTDKATQSFKNDGPPLMPWNTHQHVENRWVCAETYDLEKNLPYWHGVTFRGVSASKRDGYWLCTVRGERRGEWLAAYFEAPTFSEAWDIMLYSCTKGRVSWSPSRY